MSIIPQKRIIKMCKLESKHTVRLYSEMKGLMIEPYSYSITHCKQFCDEGRGFVATIDDDLIAFVLFVNTESIIEKKDVFTICSLGTRKEYQGLGIGTKLMLMLLEANPFIDIYLHVRTTNNIALKLYNKLGFNQLIEIKEYYIDTDPKSDAYYMCKKADKLPSFKKIKFGSK